ncbi:unnamed protein product [Amoebophrya sp. A25]|nr:unnamed protein product [Amoebophrya sp. A25]|eukprot:GSA25T00023217001.1
MTSSSRGDLQTQSKFTKKSSKPLFLSSLTPLQKRRMFEVHLQDLTQGPSWLRHWLLDGCASTSGQTKSYCARKRERAREERGRKLGGPRRTRHGGNNSSLNLHQVNHPRFPARLDLYGVIRDSAAPAFFAHERSRQTEIALSSTYLDVETILAASVRRGLTSSAFQERQWRRLATEEEEMDEALDARPYLAQWETLVYPAQQKVVVGGLQRGEQELVASTNARSLMLNEDRSHALSSTRTPVETELQDRTSVGDQQEQRYSVAQQLQEKATLMSTQVSKMNNTTSSSTSTLEMNYGGQVKSTPTCSSTSSSTQQQQQEQSQPRGRILLRRRQQNVEESGNAPLTGEQTGTISTGSRGLSNTSVSVTSRAPLSCVQKRTVGARGFSTESGKGRDSEDDVPSAAALAAEAKPAERAVIMQEGEQSATYLTQPSTTPKRKQNEPRSFSARTFEDQTQQKEQMISPSRMPDFSASVYDLIRQNGGCRAKLREVRMQLQKSYGATLFDRRLDVQRLGMPLAEFMDKNFFPLSEFEPATDAEITESVNLMKQFLKPVREFLDVRGRSARFHGACLQTERGRTEVLEAFWDAIGCPPPPANIVLRQQSSGPPHTQSSAKKDRENAVTKLRKQMARREAERKRLARLVVRKEHARLKTLMWDNFSDFKAEPLIIRKLIEALQLPDASAVPAVLGKSLSEFIKKDLDKPEPMDPLLDLPEEPEPEEELSFSSPSGSLSASPSGSLSATFAATKSSAGASPATQLLSESATALLDKYTKLLHGRSARKLDLMDTGNIRGLVHQRARRLLQRSLLAQQSARGGSRPPRNNKDIKRSSSSRRTSSKAGSKKADLVVRGRKSAIEKERRMSALDAERREIELDEMHTALPIGRKLLMVVPAHEQLRIYRPCGKDVNPHGLSGDALRRIANLEGLGEDVTILTEQSWTDSMALSEKKAALRKKIAFE